jgi:hypothetical protein
MSAKKAGFADYFPLASSEQGGVGSTNSDAKPGSQPTGTRVDGTSGRQELSVEYIEEGGIMTTTGGGMEIAAMGNTGDPLWAYAGDHQVGGPGGPDGTFSSGDVESIMNRTLPRDKRMQVAKALCFYEEDDLLQSLVNVKCDFAMSGFGIHVKEPLQINTSLPDDNEDEKKRQAKAELDRSVVTLETKQRLEDAKRKHHLRKVAQDLFRDYFTTDTMILYWRVDPKVSADSAPADGIPPEEGVIPGLVDVCALSPKDVDWDNSIGQDILRVRVPDAIRERIMIALNKTTEQERAAAIAELARQGLGEKWINAVRGLNPDGTAAKLPGFAELNRDEGDNWIVRTKGRKHHGICRPTMFSVFLSLELRKSLITGDFSAAFMMKHFVQLIQTGESIDQGQQAGSRNNWLKPKEAKSILKIFQNVSKAMRIVTNHTLKVSFVFPPKEMFNEEKFKTCESRVFNWAGIVIAVMRGEGGTYSGGFIGIKRLIASLQSSREDLSEMYQEFFDHPTIRQRVKLPPKYQAVARFDENVLKEPAQILNEIRFLVQEGLEDPYTALRELGRDPDLVKALKKTSIAEGELWNRLITQLKNAADLKRTAVGTTNTQIEIDGDNPDATAGQPGRPANPGTNANPGTRIQRPSATPQN